MKIRPYISLDIETTGLDIEKSNILQLSMVFDDGLTEVHKLKTLDVLIDNDKIDYSEPYAMKMNKWIFDNIDSFDPRYRVVSINLAHELFCGFVDECSLIIDRFNKENGVENPKTSVQFAGKNVGQFDLAIIKNQFKKNDLGMPENIQHRTLDVGPMYFRHFGYAPTLDEINSMLGNHEVTHNALDDAFNVVDAIRAEVGDE
jgi:hypothetical protein